MVRDSDGRATRDGPHMSSPNDRRPRADGVGRIGDREGRNCQRRRLRQIRAAADAAGMTGRVIAAAIAGRCAAKAGVGHSGKHGASGRGGKCGGMGKVEEEEREDAERPQQFTSFRADRCHIP